ncbi:heterokaryon incompatibility protein-domain-containing protein [Hypoxylon crocopeplum]|nr:heterokaryon incompatibility protein-domain-containing protein [Hypoxylon crocopeplum]
MLCEQCSALFSERGLRQLLASTGFRHSKLNTFGDREHCRFCRYLWNENIEGHVIPHTLRDFPPFANLSRSTSSPRLLRGWVTLWAPEGSDKRWGTLLVRVESETGEVLWEPNFPLRIVTSLASPHTAITRYRPLEWNGLNVEWAAAMQSLIFQCEASHHGCTSQTRNHLPSRVLHITGDLQTFPQVRLHITQKEGQEGQYAALSYCWGKSQRFILTHENLNSLQGGIVDSDLPQTFKDAIRTTQFLGLEYLWIDALCIIQDDPDDKSREIDRMCSIYENSAVTIVAATASSVTDGFIKPVTSFNRRYPSCDIEVTLGNNSGTLTVVPIHAQDVGMDFPINRRGWTLQEALIPPRLLVFGDMEPFLRCRSWNAIGVSETYIRYDISHIYPPRLMDTLVETRGRILDYIQDRPAHIWPPIVHEYSHRILSFDEDRPIAIRGVIDFLSRAIGDKCYFGVWSSFSIPCLLWHQFPGEEARSIPNVPTWSWMSTTSAVRLPAVMRSHFSPRDEALVRFDEHPLQERLFVTCHVLDVEQLYMGDGVSQSWADYPKHLLNEPTDELLFQGCVVLVLMRIEENSRGNFLGIVANHEGSNVYRRVGLVIGKDPDRWLSGRREDIILI